MRHIMTYLVQIFGHLIYVIFHLKKDNFIEPREKFLILKRLRRVHWIWTFLLLSTFIVDQQGYNSIIKASFIFWIVYTCVVTFWSCPRCGKPVGFLFKPQASGLLVLGGVWPFG